MPVEPKPGFRVVTLHRDFATSKFCRTVLDEDGEKLYRLEFQKGEIHVIHDPYELEAIAPSRAPGVFVDAKFDEAAIKAFVAAMVPRLSALYRRTPNDPTDTVFC